MAVNSPEPTLFCVITVCVWLSSLYDKYVPSLDFFVFFLSVVAVSVIVIGNLLLGRNGLVLIPLGTIICLASGRSGCGWSVLGATFSFVLLL